MIFIVGLIIGPSLAKASLLPKASLACQGQPVVAPDKLGELLEEGSSLGLSIPGCDNV
jgi:hypothetical protein